MTMIATTKKTGNFIPGSGIGKNPGKIAGGRTIAPPPGGTGVFGQRPYSATTPAVSVPRGGLIDKVQQANPAATAGLPHPFDGPNYRPVSTQKQNVATVATNNVPGNKVFSASVQKVVVSDRGTFFGRKLQPVIRTVGGANKSGAKSNTPFHPNPPVVQQPPSIGAPTVEGTKQQSAVRQKSFGSTGNHWSDPNNSFIKGTHSPANPQSQPTGRWHTTKRSAV